MVNPFSIITAGIMNSFRRNNALPPAASSHTALTEYINYFLSYPALILGTGTVMLTTLGISYCFNLKPYTYLISSLSSAPATAAATAESSTSESSKYEFKYFEEYDKWIEEKQNETTNSKEAYQIENKEHIQECLNNMYYSTIKDYINDTYKEIIMCYDHATQSFAYYAKTANIPYKYLETAARKYVIETNAPEELYVDIRKEYENAKNKAEQTSNNTNEKVATTTSSTTSTTSTTAVVGLGPVVGGRNPQRNPHTTDDDAVFATFKKYNKTSNIPVSDIHSIKSSSSQLENAVLSSVQGISNTDTDTNTPPILREKANRYSYRGKIEDFETHHASYLANRRRQDTTTHPDTTTTTESFKSQKMSYQEYKEMQKKLK